MRLVHLIFGAMLVSTVFAANAQAIFIPDLPPQCVSTVACVDQYCTYCDADPGVRVTASGSSVDVYVDPAGAVLGGSFGSHVKVSSGGNYVCAKALPAFGPAVSVRANGVGTGSC